MKGRDTDELLITVPQALQDIFEDRRRESHERHEMTIQSLERAIRRRERIRAVLAGTGFLVAFCGAGSMEFSDLTLGGTSAMVIGLVVMLFAAFGIRR